MLADELGGQLELVDGRFVEDTMARMKQLEERPQAGRWNWGWSFGL